MQTRDALVLKKTMEDFPREGASAIVQTSTLHPDFPEDIRKCIRIQQTIYGLVVEEDERTNGTRLSWVI